MRKGTAHPFSGDFTQRLRGDTAYCIEQMFFCQGRGDTGSGELSGLAWGKSVAFDVYTPCVAMLVLRDLRNPQRTQGRRTADLRSQRRGRVFCIQPLRAIHRNYIVPLYCPPSMVSMIPVIYEAAGDSRNAAAFPNSSGRPTRPNTLFCASLAASASMVVPFLSARKA
jgi:hypothetical protein